MMTDAPPILTIWDGEAFYPANKGWARKCDAHFVVGEQYQIVEHHQRSMASHRHYFACINEAWKNLPEDQAERFRSAEHLRKWALIRAGHRDERSIVCASKAEARRLAAFIKPIDDYAVAVVSEAVVSIYTAKSQSMRAMGKEVFSASKEAVLDICAGLIGVDSTELTEAAHRRAA